MFLVSKVSSLYCPSGMSSSFSKSTDLRSQSCREHTNSLMPRKSAFSYVQGRLAIFLPFLLEFAPNFHRLGELSQSPRLPIFKSFG